MRDWKIVRLEVLQLGRTGVNKVPLVRVILARAGEVVFYNGNVGSILLK